MEHGLFLTGEYRSTRRSTFENYKFILKISTYSTLIQNLSFLCVCVPLSKPGEAASFRICVVPVCIVVPALVASVINYFDY